MEETKCFSSSSSSSSTKETLSAASTLSTVVIHQVKIDKKLLKQYTIPNPNQDLADTAYELMSHAIQDKTLSLDNIVEFVKIALTIVGGLKRGTIVLTSEEIKAIVIQMIQKQVETLPMAEDNRQFLINVFIPLLLPGVIDGLLVNVQAIESEVCGCFPCFKSSPAPIIPTPTPSPPVPSPPTPIPANTGTPSTNV